MCLLGDSLKSVDQTKAGKWKKYLELKAAFYLAYVSYNLSFRGIKVLINVGGDLFVCRIGTGELNPVSVIIHIYL